jgi:hypothetical protein
MNRQQAKEILLLYRPGTADQHDREFATALELTQIDAELAQWFEQHCAMQTALLQRFQQIPVPDGLKQQILSERKVKTSPPARRRVALWAAAAGLIIMVAIAGLYLRPKPIDQFAEFRGRMARIVLREYPRMDLETKDLNQIRSFLGQNQAPADYIVPTKLQQASSTGCAILDWQGKRVSMICFNSGQKTDPSETSDLFLFIIDRTALPKGPSKAAQFTQLNKLATLSWTSGDKTYVLAGMGNAAFLRKYL